MRSKIQNLYNSVMSLRSRNSFWNMLYDTNILKMIISKYTRGVWTRVNLSPVSHPPAFDFYYLFFGLRIFSVKNPYSSHLVYHMVFVYTGQNNVNAGDPGPDTPCTNRNCLIYMYFYKITCLITTS